MNLLTINRVSLLHINTRTSNFLLYLVNKYFLGQLTIKKLYSLFFCSCSAKF